MTEWQMFRLNSYICVPTFFITFILLFLMPLAGRWQNDKWRGWIHIYAYLSSLYLLFCFFWCHWPADDRMTDGEIEFIYLCTYILHTFYFALSDATGRQMTEWHQEIPVYLHCSFPFISWPADDRMTDGEIEFICLCTYILYNFYFALSGATGRQMTEWHLIIMSAYLH